MFNISITLKMIKIGKRKHIKVLSRGQKEQITDYMKSMSPIFSKTGEIEIYCFSRRETLGKNFALNQQKQVERDVDIEMEGSL